MLDNGIFSHAEFAEAATDEKCIRWGPRNVIASTHGWTRKAPDSNRDFQHQKNCLFTIGRLIREQRIEAYTYNELVFERARGRPRVLEFNALKGCNVHSCSPALERSKLLSSLNFREVIAKGGKNDRKAGTNVGEANQIPFFKSLCTITAAGVEALISNASTIGLTRFEIESLKDIAWFQFLCAKSGPETYPDIFHLWTAERNGLDGFLTLDGDLPDLAFRISREKKFHVQIKTEIFRPLDVLQRLGIDEPDPVPMEAHRFYPGF
jgi:hypothetical protein